MCIYTFKLNHSTTQLKYNFKVSIIIDSTIPKKIRQIGIITNKFVVRTYFCSFLHVFILGILFRSRNKQIATNSL